MRINVSWPGGEVTAELADTPSTRALSERLPVESTAQTWGDEVYFDVGLDLDLDPEAAQVVAPGVVCFWPPGNALALPFGPTPVSRGEECRLASAANILGKLENDPRELSSVRAGDSVRVSEV